MCRESPDAILQASLLLIVTDTSKVCSTHWKIDAVLPLLRGSEPTSYPVHFRFNAAGCCLHLPSRSRARAEAADRDPPRIFLANGQSNGGSPTIGSARKLDMVLCRKAN